ncbi:MAG: hypothetical protein ABIT05_11635 [Chitinophagaceae bacterium]
MKKQVITGSWLLVSSFRDHIFEMIFKKTSRRPGRDVELMGTLFIWFFLVRYHPEDSE